MFLFLSLKHSPKHKTHTNKGVHTCPGVYTLTKNLFLERESSDYKWREVISLLVLDNKCRAVLS